MENFTDILTPGRLLLSYGNGNKVRAAPRKPCDVAFVGSLRGENTRGHGVHRDGCAEGAESVGGKRLFTVWFHS